MMMLNKEICEKCCEEKYVQNNNVHNNKVCLLDTLMFGIASRSRKKGRTGVCSSDYYCLGCSQGLNTTERMITHRFLRNLPGQKRMEKVPGFTYPGT